jgi:hypothetical protein
MRLHEELRRINNLMRIVNEEKIPDSPEKLIRTLPDDLRELLFNQWKAKQSAKHHPEGNTLKHILVVLKRAYHHYPDDPNMIMAALFHDLGKLDTYSINPKTGEPTAYGHEDKSAEYVKQYGDWINSFDDANADEVGYIVKNHMKIKPRTWDVMKDSKKEPIMSNPAFDKVVDFDKKLDGGGWDIEKN